MSIRKTFKMDVDSVTGLGTAWEQWTGIIPHVPSTKDMEAFGAGIATARTFLLVSDSVA